MKKKISLVLCFCLVGIYLAFITGCSTHTHSYSTEVINPTIAQNGYTKHSCDCGHFYNEDYTCLLTFTSVNAALEQSSNLPTISNRVIPMGSTFSGVENTLIYEVASYRIYTSSTNFSTLQVGDEISSSANITLVWNKTSSALQAEQKFEQLLNMIEKLEQISSQYNVDKSVSTSPQLRALQYIRQTRYNTNQWNSLAGGMEGDFSEYVAQNQGTYTLTNLQSYLNFTVPTTLEEIDFVHMISIMNVACYTSVTTYSVVDLAGWLGDIIQLAGQIKRLNLSQQQAIQKCVELFGTTENSSFGYYDLLADLDSINLMQIYENSQNKSISNLIENYYATINHQTRKANFIQTTFGTNQTKQAMIAAANERLNSMYMVIWCNEENINLNNSYDKAIVDKLIELFIDYIIE